MANTIKTIVQINASTGDVVEKYSRIREVIKATGMSVSHMRVLCRNHKPDSKGRIWSYEEDIKEAITTIHKITGKPSEAEVVEILPKYHNTLSYKELSQKTGYTYEELRAIYDKYKIYRSEDEGDD